MELSHSQLVALAVIPKVTAGMSLCASGYVIYDILRERCSKGKLSPYQRLLLGMSIADLMMSFGLFVGTWAFPEDSGGWGAMGNITTCEIEGFFAQAGVAQALYNATLSTYYVLTVRYFWRPERIARQAEGILHAIPWVIGISTMIAGLALDLFNYGLWDCWINADPIDCTQSYLGEGETDCERGDNANIYQWAFHLGWVVASTVVVTVNMFLVYHAVLRQERANDKYMTHGQKKKRERSKAVAVQSYFYVLAMYISWFPVFVLRAVQLAGGQATFGMFVSIAFTIPMQGCWNTVAYLRPRYLLWRKERRRRLRGSMRGSTTRYSQTTRTSTNTAMGDSAKAHGRHSSAAMNKSMTRSTIRAIATGAIVDENCNVEENKVEEANTRSCDFYSSDDDCEFYGEEFYDEESPSQLELREELRNLRRVPLRMEQSVDSSSSSSAASISAPTSHLRLSFAWPKFAPLSQEIRQQKAPVTSKPQPLSLPQVQEDTPSPRSHETQEQLQVQDASFVKETSQQIPAVALPQEMQQQQQQAENSPLVQDMPQQPTQDASLSLGMHHEAQQEPLAQEVQPRVVDGPLLEMEQHAGPNGPVGGPEESQGKAIAGSETETNHDHEQSHNPPLPPPPAQMEESSPSSSPSSSSSPQENMSIFGTQVPSVSEETPQQPAEEAQSDCEERFVDENSDSDSTDPQDQIGDSFKEQMGEQDWNDWQFEAC